VEEDSSERITAIRRRLVVRSTVVGVDLLPRSLHSVADAPNDGAEEKIGHSGRDDGGKE
jgi:hypothetical protein